MVKIWNQNAHEKFQAIKILFRESVQVLDSAANFDTFDRMVYLKQFINPLYENLLDFQVLNKIKTEQYKFHAQNYGSRNFFEETFLDTEVYSEFSFLSLDNPATIKLGKMLFYDPYFVKRYENVLCNLS